MAVPKQRHTKSRRNKRRAHLYLKEASLSVCKKCGKKIRPHTVCGYCGHYKGREVINVLEKLTKKDKKAREKEIGQKEQEEKKKPITMEEMSKK